ncbi:MAG: amidohydrolase family protein [Aquabacterium sp.]|nr:amidohydrolase family protein [Ferruginibacter sp.]
MQIDAHQHFWQFDPVRDSWINDEMTVIRNDFLPQQLQRVLQQNNIDGCVTVQSDQSEKENEFQLNNAAEFDFIKGVVGWVDLQSQDVEERLAYYSGFKKMKGFRHVLQGEADRALMLKPAFMKGISHLQKFGFTYDILIFPDQLKFVAELVAAFPDQKFVIDHIAKPNIKAQKIDDWKKDIGALRIYKNLWCKISGMVTEADWKTWKPEDFTPYLDTVVENFGADKIMFGSDWPVCLVAAAYEKMLAITTDYFAAFTDSEKTKFFGFNAVEFYNL